MYCVFCILVQALTGSTPSPGGLLVDQNTDIAKHIPKYRVSPCNLRCNAAVRLCGVTAVFMGIVLMLIAGGGGSGEQVLVGV